MTSERSFIRVTGLLYLISFVVAGTASVHVLPRLIVAGDAAATATNIEDAEWALNLAVAGDLVTGARNRVEIAMWAYETDRVRKV